MEGDRDEVIGQRVEVPEIGPSSFEALEDRAAVLVEEALANDAFRRGFDPGERGPRAGERLDDGAEAIVQGSDDLLDDAVEGARGLDHLARHEFPVDRLLALVEDAEQE